jgi:hypothetical protein
MDVHMIVYTCCVHKACVCLAQLSSCGLALCHLLAGSPCEAYRLGLHLRVVHFTLPCDKSILDHLLLKFSSYAQVPAVKLIYGIAVSRARRIRACPIAIAVYLRFNRHILRYWHMYCNWPISEATTMITLQIVQASYCMLRCLS